MLATHFLVEDAVLAMPDGSWLMADGCCSDGCLE
jgi:hypothetical protein